jgi:hypothetical protein
MASVGDDKTLTSEALSCTDLIFEQDGIFEPNWLDDTNWEDGVEFRQITKGA